VTARRPIFLIAILSGCGHAPANDAPPPIAAQAEKPAEPAPIERPQPAPRDDEVSRGELPWWYALPAGVYRFDREIMVVGIGDSKDHHHVAEGFLQAKVTARLGVRRASEAIRFAGAVPEPSLEDLFITRERRILALYTLRVPKDAAHPPSPKAIERPAVPKHVGRHRIGRHVFEGDRHLFLECDVEGPIANPDWGRTRAAARN
jgi:hypothetical protein